MQYIYDFGTSTDLKLRVVDERQGRAGSMYKRENPFYCELHAEDHDCDEPEMLLPVVSSPRMGMCGYTGPE